MTTTTYKIYHKPTQPKELYVIDSRNAVNLQTPDSIIELGEFEHASHDRGPDLLFKAKELLVRCGIVDIGVYSCHVSYYEQTIYYELPSMLTLTLDGEPQKIPVEVHPAAAVASFPTFEAKDHSIIMVEPDGTLVPQAKGETIILVRASDNPVLLYEVPVIVE